MPACGYKLYLRVFNSIFHSFTAFTHDISSKTLEDKLIRIHARACDILYLLHRYWWNTRIFPFPKKSYLHRAQWRYYLCEDIGVAMVTNIIFLFFIRILTFWNRKYKYYCLYFSFITLYPSFITFFWQAFCDRWPL